MADPTVPTRSPSTDPTLPPSTDPTLSPSTDPTLSPSTDPTKAPTTDPIFSGNGYNKADDSGGDKKDIIGLADNGDSAAGKENLDVIIYSTDNG